MNRIAPRRIRVQAALWVTDLHGPDRDADLDLRVRRWIAEDPRHAAAFELATEAWQRSGNLPGYLAAPEPAGRRAPGRLPRWAGVCAAVLIAVLMTALYAAHDGTLATGPGEQKTVQLSDGSQVSLNANSRVMVAYDEHVRRVTLDGGEALFNVAKHQLRPFVVVVGARKVIAMGTSFLVRREAAAGSAYAVTLVEGRVAVEPLASPDVLPIATTSTTKLLSPGERLRFAGTAAATLDSPSIDKVTAWQRGQLIFDDASLGEAAAEFNRYGSRQLIIGSARAAALRVGGVFRIGDPSSFAHAMATAYQLRMRDRGGDIILDDAPSDRR